MALMRLLFTGVVGLGGFVTAQSGTAKGPSYDVLDYVDQLIGSSNGGLRTQDSDEELRFTFC